MVAVHECVGDGLERGVAGPDTLQWAMRKVRYQIAVPDMPALRWASLK